MATACLEHANALRAGGCGLDLAADVEKVVVHARLANRRRGVLVDLVVVVQRVAAKKDKLREENECL